MPHAILVGQLDLEEVWKAFSPHKKVEGARVQNWSACFMRNDAKQLLFRCIARDLGVTQTFFTVVEDKGKSFTVKCVDDPNLEKGPIIQHMIARISSDLIERGLRLEKTNLADLQGIDSPEEAE